jgi:hypothetical protein
MKSVFLPKVHRHPKSRFYRLSKTRVFYFFVRLAAFLRLFWQCESTIKARAFFLGAY